MNRHLSTVFALAAALAVAAQASSHCQIPCGIYNDELRVQLIEEHITTVEKSMTQIVELSKDPAANANQLARWVVNKEDHAQQIQDIVTAYFMAQRIKHPEAKQGEAYENYVEQLTLLHQIQVYAMKVKQTTDQGNVAKLRELVSAFRTSYFGPEDEHGH